MGIVTIVSNVPQLNAVLLINENFNRMENQKLQDLEKIFKAGGDAVCLPNTKPQTLTEFLNKNEDLALRLGVVIQSVCCCINWHPSVKTDEGKKAVCSNCNRPRHTVV